MKVIVETSARHLHVTQADLEVLFGKGAELTKKKDLSQPGQYASEQRVDVVGPKRSFPGVSILGPVRKETQVELSATDARSIGIPIVIRESGVLDGTPGCKLVGPCGEIELDHGVIVAKRHVHLTPDDAKKGGFADKQEVLLKIDTPNGRNLVFDDVVIRVRADFAAACHIDTDEANAAGSFGEVYGDIIAK